MDSSPFDLTDIGVRPTTPIPPDLVRIFFVDVTADKVYYVKYITHPGTFEWLLVKVTSKDDQVTFGPVWYLGSMGHWSPLGTTMKAAPAQIDTDIPDGSLASRYHFYVPEPNSTRNLAPKPAPRGVHQRKARRISSRKSRRNNKNTSKSRRNNKNSSKSRR